MPKKILTLVFIEKEGQVLLGMKKRGFGAGRWNGFGGKLEAGETPEQAAIRETIEEAGVVPDRLEERGILEFEFNGSPGLLEVHVFEAGSYEGEPRETEEMQPKWFNLEDIPYDDMWPDDRFWLPAFLAGERFTGRFVFDENDQVLSHRLQTVA